MSTTLGKTRRKTKRSYTLSSEVVLFLENQKKQRRAPSVSAVLEELVQEVQRAQEREAIERAVTEYYSTLSDDERKEQREWGEFAARQLRPGKDDSAWR